MLYFVKYNTYFLLHNYRLIVHLIINKKNNSFNQELNL